MNAIDKLIKGWGDEAGEILSALNAPHDPNRLLAYKERERIKGVMETLARCADDLRALKEKGKRVCVAPIDVDAGRYELRLFDYLEPRKNEITRDVHIFADDD